MRTRLLAIGLLVLALGGPGRAQQRAADASTVLDARMWALSPTTGFWTPWSGGGTGGGQQQAASTSEVADARLWVSADGGVTWTPWNGTTFGSAISLPAGSATAPSVTLGTTSQPGLFQDGNYTIGLANGTNPQAFNTYTPGLAATPQAGKGLEILNNTASTAGVPVQMSGRVTWLGHGWNSTSVADENNSFFVEHLPATVAGTITGTLKFGYRNNAGTETYPFQVNSTGTGVFLNGAQVGAGSVVSFLGRGGFAGFGDGQILLRDNGGTHGIALDVNGTDGLLKIRNQAENADANISFAAATASGPITTAANSTTVAPITLTHGTVLTTATADAVENDGVSLYSTVDTTNGRRAEDAWNYFRLTSGGGGITGIADFFGATDGIPLVANGVYEIEWRCYFSQATAGTATWTIVTATTALATLTAEYVGSNTAGIGTVGAPQTAAVTTTASSSTALPVTGTEATGATHQFVIHAILTAGNGASNTRLRLTMGAGTATPLTNSYFKVRRLPGGNIGTFVS